VLVLLSAVVLVLGFALGGAARSALPYVSASVAEPAGGGARPPAVAFGVAPSGSSSARTTAVPWASPQPSAGGSVGALPVAATASTAGRAAAQPRPLSDVFRGRPLPAHSGDGRRIVYQESSMHLWVVGADGVVIRDYPVTGRPGWPRPGSYKVFSKSLATVSPKYGVTFDYMVRFAKGRSLNIGFHDIPRVIGSGKPIQAEEDLGAPVGHGGCVRQRTPDAKWLYGWATIGTPVYVLR
jgi:lipoprotein-anchoring transpeptidase ErfK/SrfK